MRSARVCSSLSFAIAPRLPAEPRAFPASAGHRSPGTRCANPNIGTEVVGPTIRAQQRLMVAVPARNVERLCAQLAYIARRYRLDRITANLSFFIQKRVLR
jgi:hypothetical protein